MSTKSKLLELLDSNYGSFVSGQEIADTLGISRAAVNKAAAALKKSGYKILSRTGQGYKLLEKAGLLSSDAISAEIGMPCEVVVFDSIPSTNDYAKTLKLGDKPVAVVANSQTAGRGRLGREFYSPRGTGIYLTIALRPRFEINKFLNVTMAAAVAVCRAIESECGVHARIKWVNDLYYRDRKICGILTEAGAMLETGTINSLIIGIGINCFPGSFPPELSGIAGPISDTPDSFSRNALAGKIINDVLDIIDRFPDRSFMTEYRQRCFIIGREVDVIPAGGGKPVLARVHDIDTDGGLVVEYMSGVRMREIETLTSGEVSIRKTDGEII